MITIKAEIAITDTDGWDTDEFDVSAFVDEFKEALSAFLQEEWDAYLRGFELR